MAFRRSVARLAAGAYRQDVQPALKKLWKKYSFVDGMITRHISPFEQKIVSPLFKDAFSKTLHNVSNFVLEAGWGLGAGIFIYYWAEKKHAEIAFHHRS